MNRIYRSIWNDKTRTFVAVSENASNGGRKASSGGAVTGTVHFALKGLVVSLMLAFGPQVYANPTGGTVSAGAASIAGGAGKMTIKQTSQNVAINWQGFSIGTGEAVRFAQPNSSSVALNRVLGPNPSNILGSLSANGKVFLVNPNGILFGKGASVNVGGLVASTRGITDSDFMAGKYNFTGTGNGAVINQGSINADGGYVALLGANVSNEGVITAKLGTVALAAGKAMTLDVAGDGLLNVAVNQGAVNALAANGGLIQADGGQVLLTAKSAGNLLQSAVNNTGVIQAQTIENHNGTIRLMGDMQSGSANVGGKLDASAPNGGDGGFIETSAARVNVADGTIVTAQSAQGKSGTWLLDPNDITIQTAGADTNVTASPSFTSTNDSAIVTTASIQTALNAGTSVVVTTGTGGANTQLGDITVTGPISYNAPSAATTLTLNAAQDIFVNAPITATTGSFAATAGRDVRVNAATATTTGNLTLTAVRDVYLAAATTVVTGNLSSVAGGNVNVSAASTITTGNMVFRADNDGTGPGAAAGTVSITCGLNCLTITTGNLIIRFNPDGYANTAAEITAYGGNLTGAGVLDAKAWVFGLGENKIYDGTRTAIVSGLKPDISAAAPAVIGTLGAVTTPLFDTKHVGTNKLITYGSTFADPVYELFAPFGTAGGTYTTRADVFVRPLTVAAVTDTRVYNGTTSSVGVPTVTGLQVGDVPVDTLNGPLTQAYASKDVMGTGGSTLVATGPYTVTDGNGGNNYVITVNTAPGTITPAPLTIRANDNTKVYGQTFAPATTAFTLPVPPIAGETVTGVTETSAGSAPTASVAGSTYPIVITPGSETGTITASNYTITYQNGALTVTPAPLTVTANDNTKVFGTVFTPASTAFTTTALQNGETVGTVTEVSPAGTPATAAVPGPYAIIPSNVTGGTFTPTNYTINYVNGALTVTPLVVPPVVVPPVVVPPVVVPPVVVPPVVVPPVVVVPPGVVPPVVAPPGTVELIDVPPYLAPEKTQPVQVPDLNLTVIGTGVTMPPPVTLARLAPPPPPPPVQAPPVVAPPPVYVPPVYPPRKDRN
jgi:filamentous hemagglutinin family protein